MSARLTGRHFVPGFVGLIVLLSAIALWQRSENEKLEVLSTRTLDDGSKLELARTEGETFDAYLTMRDQEGTSLWRKGIYKLVDPELRGVTVADQLITIRAADKRGNHETHAFSRDDGAFLWRGGRIKQAAPVAKPSQRVGDEIVEYYGPPVNARLRLSAINGDLLSKEPWPSASEPSMRVEPPAGPPTQEASGQ